MRLSPLLLFLPALVLAKGEVREPEAATGLSERQAVTGQKLMMATANPLATQAGFEMLSRGGSAVDAVIAANLVLTLTEPQSSGIGGGAFMMIWDRQQQSLRMLDARETAPRAATPELFLTGDQAMDFFEALVGGRSVGVPGLIKGFWEAHRRHGKLPWPELFAPAIRLALEGFEVSPRLAKLLAIDLNPGLRQSETAREYFYPHGQPLKAGARLKNPALAESLLAIAEQGPQAFYEGPLAETMVKVVRGHKGNPGLLALADLKAYQPQWREVLCSPYRQYRVCGAPAPAGGLVVSQLLGLLDRLPAHKLASWNADSVHLFSQASRLAFADRNRYLADPDFVEVPAEAMLAPKYLDQRARLITDRDEPKVAGELLKRLDTASPELPSTSHLVAIDGDGNAVSMTASIEMGFGSTLMAGGFLLNNQLTDFNFVPRVNGERVANRAQGGKRPRSSMAPVMVFKGPQLQGLVGSPGGSRIINYVAKTLVGVIDGGLDIQQAISLPNVTNRNDYTALEKGTAAEAWVAPLKARGHQIKVQDLNSGIQGLWRLPDGRWQGGADPRREGMVLAQ
ncbi:gamma-glutamyltransferase [Gallaecimonas sp. GXIMD4217]|uniref:gamma-glutamyltransferase n=1 Tax=Gallaecimonas sp. GXIMD4217 TaxID=3131927 RepID=UPI00311B25B4